MQRLSTFRRVAFAVVTACALLAPTASAQFPDMFYYKFDEAAGTTTANLANPGAVITPATINGHTLGAAGQFNGGILGNGSTASNVDTGWVTNLGSGSWTVHIYLDLSAVATVNPFGYFFGDSTATSWRCFCNGAAGTGNVIMRGPHADVIIAGGADQTMGHALTWVHDASAGVIKGYLDGALVNTVSVGTINVTGSQNLFVAAYGSSSALPAGTIYDEFRMYSYALTDAEVMATATVELFDQNLLSITQSGPGVGDLRVSMDMLSPTAAEGWTFLSANVSGAEGSGPLLGITPDSLSWYSFSVPYFPGNVFHFNGQDAGVFPQVPFVVGPGAVSGLAGQTFDVVSLFLNAGGAYDSKSNVVRYTFQ